MEERMAVGRLTAAMFEGTAWQSSPQQDSVTSQPCD